MCDQKRSQKNMEIEPHSSTSEVDSALSKRTFLPEVALVLGLCIITIIVGRMIYHDSFVDGSTYSNRSFALPGAGFSLLLVVPALIANN